MSVRSSVTANYDGRYSPAMDRPPILCYKCQRLCRGEVLRVENRHFHISCFTCKVCGCDLAQCGFFMKNGDYVCTLDYQRLYGTRCQACGDFVEGEVVTALGRTYHLQCFVCSVCRQPFPSGARVTFNGKACVCQECAQPSASLLRHSRLASTECVGCGRDIKNGQALLALEHQWHMGCFKCHTCGKVLTGEYISKEGMPYCERDYHAQYGVRCDGCDKYITGRVLEAGDKRYHPNCARCFRCHRMFSEGEEMFLQGSSVWHPDCKKAAKSEERKRQRVSSEMVPSHPSSSPSGSPSHSVYARVDNEMLDYKDLAAIPREKAIYDIERPDLITYEPHYLADRIEQSSRTISPTFYHESHMDSHEHLEHQYSSHGTATSPSYMRRSYAPSAARSPQHFHCPDDSSNIYRKPPVYKQYESSMVCGPDHLVGEEVIQSAKFPAAHPPDPRQPAKIEMDYWPCPPSLAAVEWRRRRGARTAEDDTEENEEEEEMRRRHAIHEHNLSKVQSGLGQLILREEMDRLPAPCDLDPRSSSRTPSASSEPAQRTRYDSPLNASPSRRLCREDPDSPSKSSSLPGYNRNDIQRHPSTEFHHYHGPCCHEVRACCGHWQPCLQNGKGYFNAKYAGTKDLSLRDVNSFEPRTMSFTEGRRQNTSRATLVSRGVPPSVWHEHSRV
uniref:actin-binding LIM protein 1-like n=1 Tax=Myxine glutinosa TaxID=7769 RepID=UPI00358E412B